MKSAAVILVFARAPIPGRAKTRLAPRLGEWGAARLQARLTLRALSMAKRAACGQVELHGAPRGAHAFFRHCRNKFRVRVKAQRGADLGKRMHRALSMALRSHRVALLIGTDCPDLGPRDLQRAARLLRGACAMVLAPAEDGGYALIGARRVSPALFEGVSWGSSEVFSETRIRLAAADYQWRALRKVWDIDRPEDLERHVRLLPYLWRGR